MTEWHMYLLDIKSSPTLIGQNNNITYVFYQVELVDKNKLGAQNPRSDTSALHCSFKSWWLYTFQINLAQTW